MVFRIAALAALVALLMLVPITPASACAPCSTGDPTLTVTGVEKPYAGRFRVSAQFQHRTESSGVPVVDAIESAEQRLELNAAYATFDWLFIAAKIPLVHRRATYVNLAHDDIMSLGDIELLAKAFVYQDRSLSARHLVAVSAGVGLPTAPVFRDDGDRPLPLEAQPGTGALRGLIGASYGYFVSPLSFYASVNFVLPVVHRSSIHTGMVGLVSLAAQYQPHDVIAFRTSLDARLDEALQEDGVIDPHSGGLATFVSPELVVSPIDDLLFRFAVQIPAYRRINGISDEGISVLAGVAYDLE